MTKIAIYGLGNVLLGDDAVGPTIVETIAARWEFPADVRCEDLGTPSLDLAEYLFDQDFVLFVDAVEDDAAPGTVLTYDRAAILRHPPGLRLSPHDPSLKETLLALEFSGDKPAEVMMIGIVPKQTEIGAGLSSEVRAAIPAAMARVREELERRGVAVNEREGANAEYWWK